MKKNKVSSIILMIIFCFVIVNTIISYVSYEMISNNKEPKLYLGMVNKGDMVTYNQLLYKITVLKEKNTRTVSLKLFFLD